MGCLYLCRWCRSAGLHHCRHHHAGGTHGYLGGKPKKKRTNQPHPRNNSDEISITEIDEDQGAAYEGSEEGEETVYEEEAYEVEETGKEKDDKNSMVLGAALILIGLMFFSRNFFKWFWIDFSYLWPILLILLGVVMVVNKRK